MSGGPYQIDTLIQVSSNPPFADPTGAPIDPTTVTLWLEDPTGAVQEIAQASLTRLSTGVWSYQFAAAISGWWTYKFQGQGNVTVTSPDARFLVEASAVIAG